MTKPRGNAVRIISGKWRGRKLSFPALADLRPTPDRARETLFSWLNELLDDARCLDLFAGSGCLGFEALSRGARHCTFVDVREQAIMQINAHINVLSAAALATRADARRWLAKARADGQRFDVIFLDPPYASTLTDSVLPACVELCAPGGCIYVEHDRHSTAPVFPDDWVVVRETEVGVACMRLLRRHADFTV